MLLYNSEEYYRAVLYITFICVILAHFISLVNLTPLCNAGYFIYNSTAAYT